MRVNLSGNEAYTLLLFGCCVWVDLLVNNVIAHKSYYTVRKSWVARSAGVGEGRRK